MTGVGEKPPSFNSECKCLGRFAIESNVASTLKFLKIVGILKLAPNKSSIS